jgi:hypothetical protein
VVNGTRTPTHVPLDAEQQNAVVGVMLTDMADRASCSGTLIADRYVLTAKHCTEGRSATYLKVIFGQNDLSPLLTMDVQSKREHATHDMTILVLPSAPSIAVRPIPIALENLTNADVTARITLEQAGYGDLGNGTQGGRYFAAEKLVRFETEGDVLVVDGEGQRGVCWGDSGGPSMRIAPAGDARVVGALSWGDQSCVDQDRYARTDVVRPWIEGIAGPTPTAGPQPCGTVTTTGSCDASGTHATWCNAGALQRDTCQTGTVCAMSSGVGYRCIPVAQDPCQGHTYYGRCNGQTLVWCANGQILSRPCSQCGEECTLVDETTGYACVAGGCGNLDYLGACEGNVAVWCDNGQRMSQDCTPSGETCQWVNSQIGYYCN